MINHIKVGSLHAKELQQAVTNSLLNLKPLLFRIFSNVSFLSSSKNELLFALHGSLVCVGLILYSIGSKNLPAAELTLLSLTEVVGGIFWVWLPIFGINEVPTTNTIIGGSLVLFAIFYYSLLVQRNRRFIGLT